MCPDCDTLRQKKCPKCNIPDRLLKSNLCSVCDMQTKSLCSKCNQSDILFLGLCLKCSSEGVCSQCNNYRMLLGKICFSCDIENRKEECPQCKNYASMSPFGICYTCKMDNEEM